MAACRREENFFSLSPTLHPCPSAINTPRIPFFQATESFISQKLRLILPPLPPNIPTLKWQSLVMIYGPNFILFLFFFPVGLPLCRFPPSQFDAAATVHYVCRAIYVVFMHP